MAKVKIDDLGQVGIVYDIKPATLPPEVWSNGRNVRISSNRVSPIGGAALFPDLVDIDIKWVGLTATSLNPLVVYGNLEKLYATDGTSHTEITKAATTYAATDDALWQMETFGGLPIFNNSIDIPQLWSPPGTSTALVNLINWPSTLRAKAVRSYKSHMFALNCAKGATLYPHMVKWSHPAEPGAVPVSWDETDPVYDAGETTLPDTDAGFIQDGRILGEFFVVYKENSIWMFRFVGGNNIFAKDQVAVGVGLRAPKTLVSIPGKTDQHFFMGLGDCYVFDGRQAVPIFHKVLQKTINRLINQDRIERAFSVVNTEHQEVWLCIPEIGEDWPSVAVVWNYRDGTYSIKDLGPTSFAANGYNPNPTVIQKIYLDGLPYSQGIKFSDGKGFKLDLAGDQNTILLEATGAQKGLYIADSGLKAYGETTVRSRYIERRSLAIAGQTREGRPIVDYTKRKLISRVYPKVLAGSVKISVGVQEHEEQTITWTTPISARASDRYIDLPEPVSGRFISLKFTASDVDNFDLSGFDFEIDILGDS